MSIFHFYLWIWVVAALAWIVGEQTWANYTKFGRGLWLYKDTVDIYRSSYRMNSWLLFAHENQNIQSFPVLEGWKGRACCWERINGLKNTWRCVLLRLARALSALALPLFVGFATSVTFAFFKHLKILHSVRVGRFLHSTACYITR
jgi:hypothetical protein